MNNLRSIKLLMLEIISKLKSVLSRPNEDLVLREDVIDKPFSEFDDFEDKVIEVSPEDDM